jgi:DNA-binding response OmpR family regulator
MRPRRPTVLLVERDSNAQLYMAQTLRGAGYNVLVAGDAEEGWQKAAHEQPECIIIDPFLPGRSGFELCRQLRFWDPDHYIAIILLGTKESPSDRAWSLRQGADFYLPRPFTEAMLVQVVSGMVSLTEQAPPPAPPPPRREEVEPATRQPPVDWQELIPHRREDPDLLAAVNPFSGAQVIADKQARRVYGTIDGRKTLQELALALNLDWKALIKALRVLFALERIQFMTPDGRLVDGRWLFDLR